MKTTTSLTLDSEVILKLKSKNINVSGVVNSFLKTYLEMPQDQKEHDVYTIDNEIQKAMVKLTDLKTTKKKLKKEVSKDVLVHMEG
jgi:methenyltetrahydromethanopterin cyclohydrolase